MHVLKTISYSLFIFIIITLDKSEGGTFIIRLVKWQFSGNNQCPSLHKIKYENWDEYIFWFYGYCEF